MPIGTGIIYNVGDLILGTVSGSGTAFLETKIAAATSSIVYFDSNARINSASLNSITVGTASYVSGSTSIITNLTASNISASGTGSFGIVGIGTTVPSAKLEVANTGRILGVLRLHITPQTTFYDNTFAVGTDGGGANGFIYTSGTGGTFPLDTYGELILQAGPKTGYNNGISLVTGTTSPSVKLRIAEGGNVGIGTTSPTANLTVYNSSTPTIDFNTGASTVRGRISATSSDLTIAALTSSPLVFKIDTSEKARIDAGGAVGIGTTTVSRILHAYVTTGPVMRVQSSGSNASIEFIPSIGHNRYNWLIGAQQNISDAFEITPSTATNGTTFTTPAILVASSGNIGIGTTSPTQRLDLSGSLRIQSTGTYSDPADNAGFINYDSTGGIFTFSARSNGGNTYMAFRTSNAGTAGERMRIINDGNVGIGTTLPASRLHVDKSSQTLGSSTPSGATIISNLAGGNAILELGVDTTNLSYIQSRNVTDQTYYKLLLNPSGGSVGIGTTSPDNRFEVVGSTFNRASFIATANVQTGIQIQRTGGVSNTDWEIYSPPSSGDLRIYNGSDYVTFQSGSGNVGIGTTSPSVKLHVDGFFISKTLWSDTAAHSYWGNYSTAYGRLTWDTGLAWINATAGNVLYLGADGANKHVTIATSGNVGIGTTSPDTNLEIYKSVSVAGESYQDILTVTAVDNDGGYFYTGLGAGIAFRSGKTSANVYGPSIMGSIYGANSGDESVANGYLSFHTRNSNTVAERMRIINDGNVGIGTTSPAAKLQVAGNISGSSFTSSISNAVGFLGTSSWAQNVVSASFATTAQTANALNASNNYQVNSIGVGIAGSGTAGRIGTNENGVRSWTITPTGGRLLFESGDANGSAYFVFPVTASTFVGAGTGLTGTAASLTAGTANALNASNTYTIAGLTSAYVDVNGSGTIPTTGIYRPSTKTLGLSADGTLIFKISNVSSPATSSIETGNFIVQTGNVGIGTTSPTINGGGLHVYGSGQKGIRISGNSSNSYSVEIGCDTTKMSYIQTVGTADRGLQFYTGNASTLLMTLTGSNVGIGTTVPTAKLQIGTQTYATAPDATYFVAGNDDFSGPGPVGAISGYPTVANKSQVTASIFDVVSGWEAVNGSHAILRVSAYNVINSAPAFVVLCNGNVGIGTTSPGALLDVNGLFRFQQDIRVNNGTDKLILSATSTTTELHSAGTTGIVFKNAGNVEIVRFDAATGNVGIGTSSPAVKLDVVGTTETSIRVADTGGSSLELYQQATDSYLLTTNALRIYTSGSARMSILNNGNVGIGRTSPQQKLHIAGTNARLAISNDSDNNWAEIGNDGSSGQNTLEFFTGTSVTPAMSITNDNNVGIGTSSPVAALDVSRLEYPSLGGVLANFSAGTTDPTTEKYVILRQTYTGTAFDSPMLVFRANANSANSGSFGIVRTTSNGSIVFSNVNATSGTVTAVSEKMRINSDGNVGIGTTSPATILQVVGTGVGSVGTINIKGASAHLGLTNAAGTFKGWYGYYNSTTHGSDNDLNIKTGYAGTSNIRFSTDGDTTAAMLYIKSDGNVGIGTTNPATKLAVNGVSSFGLSSKLSMIGLDINSGETPTYVKIITTIPVASGAADFTVNIKGFIYGASRNADISISWHYYNSTFYNPIAKSSGGWAPTIRLSAEGGFVAIVLSTPGYWPKFYVESMYSSAYNNQYVSGWSWVDADATGSPIVTVPYASDFGNSFVMLTNGNVGIGTTSPNAKLDVNGSIYLNGNIRNVWGDNLFNVTQYPSNFSTSPSYYMGFQTDATNRIFYISNKDEDGSATDPNGGIIFRTGGTPTNRMLISYTGNVGIGTTSPTTKLYVSGSVTALDGRFISNVTSGTDKYFLDCYGTSTNQIFALYENSNTAYLNSYSSMAFRANQNGGSGGYFVFSGANVGIGTTVPTGQLHLYSSTSTIMKFDRLDTSTFGFEIGGTTFGLYDYTNSEFRWRAFSRNLIINESYGDVGIGTAAPAAKLEISGSSNSALLNIKSPISGAILYVSGSGAVGIGTSNVGAYTLQVNGSFAATTKSFVIEHPTKAGKKLIYGSLESPYHGIRLTGRDTLVNGKSKIQLPDYIYKLILHDSVNIQLTGIKCNKTLYVDEINIPENYFTIAYDKAIFESYKDYDFFWDFTGIRTDVPELITEL